MRGKARLYGNALPHSAEHTEAPASTFKVCGMPDGSDTSLVLRWVSSPLFHLITSLRDTTMCVFDMFPIVDRARWPFRFCSNGYLSYGGVQPKYIALLLDLDGTHSVPRARCLVARCTAVSSLPRLRARGSPGRLRGGPGHAKSGKRTDTTSLYPLACPRPTTDTRALPSQCDGHRRCPQRVGVLYRNNRPARSVLVAGAS